MFSVGGLIRLGSSRFRKDISFYKKGKEVVGSFLVGCAVVRSCWVFCILSLRRLFVGLAFVVSAGGGV